MGILPVWVQVPPSAHLMKIKIRRFRSKDLENVLKISLNSFSRPWSRNEFEKNAAETFVAEKDGKIAGFIVGKKTVKDARIKLIAVIKYYRKQGTGRKLVEYLLNHFKKNGAKKASAHVRIGNKAGLSFLKSFGFDVIGIVKEYYADKESAYFLERELS